MATTKKRINISVSQELDDVLGKLAERDQVPQATKAEHLIRMAIEIEEDQVLDEIAQKRDTNKARFVSHSVAWR
jgi:predicted transcriptional regulator